MNKHDKRKTQDRWKNRKYMIQVTLKCGENQEKFVRAKRFVTRPVPGEKISIKAGDEKHVFHVRLVVIASRKMIWVICSPRSLSPLVFQKFLNDKHWTSGRAAELW